MALHTKVPYFFISAEKFTPYWLTRLLKNLFFIFSGFVEKIKNNCFLFFPRKSLHFTNSIFYNTYNQQSP